nr:MAG TPA: hypothetical protein [Caudoviricetes sp.]
MRLYGNQKASGITSRRFYFSLRQNRTNSWKAAKKGII